MSTLDGPAERLAEADLATAKAAARLEKTAFARFLDPVADLGDQPSLRILCGSTIAVGLVGGDRRLLRAGLRMLAAHTLATLAKDFVKRRIDRTRPRSAVGRPGKDHRLSPGRDESKEETSFPSGHAAGAVAVARAFARDYPDRAAPAYAAAGLLSLAQIPRCAHYPTDIAAGAAIGLAAESLAAAAFSRFEGRSGTSGPEAAGRAGA